MQDFDPANGGATIASRLSAPSRFRLPSPSAILGDVVHLARLRLRNFRNYTRFDQQFEPGFHVLIGRNAQGKTNLLESIYLIATLRSFRGVGGAQMIQHGQKGYFVGGTVVSDATHEIKAFWSPRERQLTLDGTPVRRVGDYLGTLRTVVFCTEDLQLVKGSSRMRRRFLDLLLVQTQPGYLDILLRYAAALKSRNALLKQRVVDDESLAGFTRELVEIGEKVMTARRLLVPKISPLVRLAFRRIADDVDELRLDYAPSIKSDFTVELANQRERERIMRMTLIGPHRDELRMMVNEAHATQFTSEGQKRTLALALKMAQAEYLSGIHGSPPILLIDDVMGELDSRRRAGFLPLLHASHRSGGQAFMTCTEQNWPRELGLRMASWRVESGMAVRTPEPG